MGGALYGIDMGTAAQIGVTLTQGIDFEEKLLIDGTV